MMCSTKLTKQNTTSKRASSKQTAAKRLKDMTLEELRLYNRQAAARSRRKKRGYDLPPQARLKEMTPEQRCEHRRAQAQKSYDKRKAAQPPKPEGLRPANWTRTYRTQAFLLSPELISRFRNTAEALRHSFSLDQVEIATRAFNKYVSDLERQHNNSQPFPKRQPTKRGVRTPWAFPVRPPNWTRTYRTQSVLIPGELLERFKDAVSALRNQLPLDETEAATQALTAYICELERQHNDGLPFISAQT